MKNASFATAEVSCIFNNFLSYLLLRFMILEGANIRQHIGTGYTLTETFIQFCICLKWF